MLWISNKYMLTLNNQKNNIIKYKYYMKRYNMMTELWKNWLKYELQNS